MATGYAGRYFRGNASHVAAAQARNNLDIYTRRIYTISVINIHHTRTPMRTAPILVFLVALLAPASFAHADDLPYLQRKDVVFGEVHGTGLLMDIFTPKGKSNGLAIVDVVSGAWYSDRNKIRDHTIAQLYDIYCSRGYVARERTQRRTRRSKGADVIAMSPRQPKHLDRADQADMDRLLDKIAASGIDSLSAEERRRLDDHSRRLREQ